MGACVVFLIFLAGSTVYAKASICATSVCMFSNLLNKLIQEIDEFVGGENLLQKLLQAPEVVNSFIRGVLFTNPTYIQGNLAYIPKSPRRPLLLVWPSVMNPRVAKAVAEKIKQREKGEEYLIIQCNVNLPRQVAPFTLAEVKRALLFPEHDRAPKFWDNLHDRAPKFWDNLHDRAPKFWDNLVPELITWLSAQALECGFYTIFREEQQQIYRFIEANRRNWVKALQELVYILVQVIAVIHHKTGAFRHARLNWLEKWVESYEYWYKTYPNPRAYLQTFITNSLDIVIAWLFDYMAKHSFQRKWRLSDDPDIRCALENYGMDKPLPYDYGMDRVPDKMRVMADSFVTCQVKRGCAYYDEMNVYIGTKHSEVVVRTPRPQLCTFTCNDLPSTYKYLAYAHAYMTTDVGHDLYCKINSTRIIRNKVTTQCHPRVVEKYITTREYQVCCKEGDPPLQPHCEIVTNTLPITNRNFTIHLNMTLTKTMKFFDYHDVL